MNNIIYLARYFHLRKKPGMFSVLPTFEVIDINKNKDVRKEHNEKVLRKSKLGRFRNETTAGDPSRR